MKATTKEYIFIGIDINQTRSMVSLLYPGLKEPETVNISPIPDQGSIFEQQDDFVEYMNRLLLFARQKGMEELEPFLAVTVAQVTPELVELFRMVLPELGILREHFLLLDYKEAFYYHTFHQDPSIRLHGVCLFDFTDHEVKYYLLHTEGAGRVKRVSVQERTWTANDQVLESDMNRDEFFSNVLRQTFMKKIVSGVYLIGDGFDGEWLKDSLRLFGTNKRVFLGKNLYTRGACYAAYRAMHMENWNIYYDCDYKLRGEISLSLIKDQKEVRLPLSRMGENWFFATPEYRMISDGSDRITIHVLERAHPNSRERELVLTELPERDGRSIRLRIQAKPRSAADVDIEVFDDGFGELFASSGRRWVFHEHFES